MQMQPLEEEEEMMMPKLQMQPEIRRQCPACQKDGGRQLQAKENTGQISPIMQRSGDGALYAEPSFSNRLKSRSGFGQPLPESMNKELGEKFGADFGGVRIHTDSHAIQMNRDIGAQAFTYGSDVYFNKGNYDPSSTSGKHLLAHELTHVVQQKGGGLQRQIMRSCNCQAISGASTPTAEQERRIGGAFPNLTSGEWCVTGSRDRSYNCHGFTSKLWTFITGPQVDRTYGNGDSIATVTDFDTFYEQTRGLRRTPQTCPPNAAVVLYEKNGRIKHSAELREGLPGGCLAESKLGGWERIVHSLSDLEGSSYGDYMHYYVPE